MHKYMIHPTYNEFAQMIYSTGILSDPWMDGKERFRLQPILLNESQAQDLALAAERIGAIYHELTEIVLNDPSLLDEFYELTPWQKAMWLASEGRWHGIARVDLFICTDGTIRSCEMNSDTPSGEAEAVILNQLLHPYYPNTDDPNAGLLDKFCEMLFVVSQPKIVAVLYPTEMPEDLSMIIVYKQWLEQRGCEVILCSPFNLSIDSNKRLSAFGKDIDLIIRHYKTDWWGERELIWTDQVEYWDPDPLVSELSMVLEAEHNGQVAIVNPFGSVITQNKKSMALMWERKDLFSDVAQQYIESYIPETYRFATMDFTELVKDQWVLKSVYGCEGDSVICGPFVSQDIWNKSIISAVPHQWVVQKFFDVLSVENDLLPNYGIYLVAGRTSGIYSRLSAKGTDYNAVTAPTFIRSM